MADIADQSKSDPQYFTGTVWLMTTGSWQVHVRATGTLGPGELPVPVPALALRTKAMQQGVGIFLIGMLVFLGVGLIAIVGASVREAEVEPGAKPPAWNRRSISWMTFTALVLIAAGWGGNAWWADDAAKNQKKIYQPLGLTAKLDGSRLELTPARKLDDLVPDHGHLMHFFLIRWPAMDVFYHLHPDQNTLALPSLPAGHYRMYGDIVHASGLAETATGEIDLPDIKGAELTGDDAGGAMPGDPKMVWLRDPNKPIVAKQVNLFRFELAGEDLEPYMGMGGHAEFVSVDGTVFAHVHPTGTVPMASEAVASREAMMAMHQTPIGKVVSFPFGLPAPGRYRVFVQLKHGSVRTAAFDFTCVPPPGTP